MMLTRYAVSWFLFLLSTPFSLSITTDCKESMQAVLGTWTNMKLEAGEQNILAISIPAGHLKKLENQNDLLKNSSLSEIASNPFSWRVSISRDDATADEPILILAKDGKSERSFEMPYTRMNNRSKVDISVSVSTRSVDLCPVDEITPNSVLTITVYSLANSTVEVNLTVELSTPWLNRKYLKEERKFETEGTLSLSSPVVRKSLFSPKVVHSDESILITVESLPDSDCFCSLVSIQQPNCPYFDDVSSAIRFGIWQTMLNKTALQIQSTDFPDGYLIIVVATESDDFCQISNEKNKCGNSTTDLKKRIKITESVNTNSKTTLTAIFVILGIYVAVILLSLGLSHMIFSDKKKSKKIKGKAELKVPDNLEIAADGTTTLLSNNIQLDTEESSKVGNADEALYVSHLYTKQEKSKVVYAKSDLFMGNFLLMSIFYSLTVLQLAYQSADKQTSTGNNDICYFNNLCQKPWGPFLDFNHFFSNIGYVVFGFVFILIVFVKQRFVKREENCNNLNGIPYQSGIYFTMGGALAMEGLMSASYHVCPTNISFQFDTTFMYLLAILMYIKLYQNRHPDTSSNSLQAYLILGVALILEAISIYYSSVAFWVIFLVVYLIFIMILATNIFNSESKKRVKKDNWFIVNVMKKSYSELKSIKTDQIRPLLVFLTITWIVNFMICVLYAVNASSNDAGASNYLLVMFMANMFVYLFYYVTMKFISGERLRFRTVVYAVSSLVCAIPALMLFINKEKNSELSPAESRDINKPCVLLEYFDGHDVWHLLGGAGVFFTFMFIFTIDADLKDTKRSTIRVF